MNVEPTAKERPILFSGPMVHAILEGRKTQTRRVIKPQPESSWNVTSAYAVSSPESEHDGTWNWLDATGHRWDLFRCPYGVPGDELWVREKWRPYLSRYSSGIQYAGGDYKNTVDDDYERLMELIMRTGGDLQIPSYKLKQNDRWRPSIHMPRWASRIQLRISDIRVERVQDISEKDAIAEGCNDEQFCHCGDPMENHSAYVGHSPVSMNPPEIQFAELWNSINGDKYPMVSNPWVWVVECERIES